MLFISEKVDPPDVIVFLDYVEKNGNGTVRICRTVDINKPKVWVEGHEYKFNSKLQSIQFTPNPK